ncbi:MAG: hypothetical protein ACK40I_07770 [Tabrizicola sp.]
MEIIVAVAIAVSVLWFLTRSRGKSRKMPSDADQEAQSGSYRVVQLPSISDEQIEFACRHSVDLLHNSLVHGRDMSNPNQWSASRGAHFSSEIEQIESYLIGAFLTVIAQICNTQAVCFHEYQRGAAFLELARQLIKDKPALYMGTIEYPLGAEAVSERLQKLSADRSAFQIGQKNADELIKHLTGDGQAPDTSLLQGLLKITRALQKP